MKNKRIILVCGMILGLTVVMTQNSCYYDKADKLYPTNLASCDTTKISYVASIKPILSSNCYSCHGASVYTVLGSGYNLEDFTTLTTQVNAGNLICDINRQSGCNAMPQTGPKLSDCNILKIEAWKTAGTPNN